MTLNGVASSFPTRKPTIEEYESKPHLLLTSEDPPYDPHDATLADHENALAKAILETGDRIGAPPPTRLCSVSKIPMALIDSDRVTLSLNKISIVHDDYAFARSLHANVSAIHSTSAGPGLTPQVLAANWGINLRSATRTVNVTTQRGIRTVLHPTLSRRFRTNDRQLRYRRLPIDCFTDTLVAKTPSHRKNSYAQIFSTPDGWCRAYPMEKKSEAHEGLSLLFQREGVPNTLIMDNAKEQIMGEFRRKCKEAGVRVRQTEPHTPWLNAAEAAIRELKKGVGRQMVRSRAPIRLWDDCLERESYIRSMTAHDIYRLDGQVPETLVSGETADISPFAAFKWYEWVLFRDTSVSYPNDTMILGRDLGPAIDIEPAMTRKVLKSNGVVVYRSTVRSMTPDENADETWSKEKEKFTAAVDKKFGSSFTYSDFANDPELEDLGTPSFEPYMDDESGEMKLIPEADDEADADTYDQYVGAEVQLSIGDKVMNAKVRGRKRQKDGTLLGKANSNPILDTRTYDVEFPDGQTSELAANVIAQNMYAQCDSEGNQYLLLAGIVDHQRDSTAVERSDMYVKQGSNRHLRKTTKGWSLCVEWKDGSTSWERLVNLKESNPVEIADYAVLHGLDVEPAFAWWVPFTLRKRNHIINAVNKRYRKRTHKFGIEVPKTYDDCVRIDKEAGNILWQDAIRKEMNKVRVAFQVLGDNENPPPTFQQM